MNWLLDWCLKLRKPIADPSPIPAGKIREFNEAIQAYVSGRVSKGAVNIALGLPTSSLGGNATNDRKARWSAPKRQQVNK